MVTANAAPTFRMKLHIDTTAWRVVFAETTKGLVDYLLEGQVSLLGLEENIWEGCVHNLYNSVDDLAAAAADERGTSSSEFYPLPSSAQAKKRFFKCSYNRRPACDGYVTERSGAICPSCGWPMATEVPCGAPGAGCSGDASTGTVRSSAAQGTPATVACILTDDLRATPMSGSRSWFATLAIMKTLFLTNFSATVEEQDVQIGHHQCMAIAEAALRSRTVLTDVFLGLKTPPSSPGDDA